MADQRQRITIIGTGCIGASMGLALRQSEDADLFEVIGHDREYAIAQAGERRGAFHSAKLNLDMALRDAKLIILAVPLAEMESTLADIGRLLPPDTGAIVTDTALLKAPVLAWAQDLLPPGAHFIGGDPFLAPDVEAGPALLRGHEQARADLFADAVYTITARPDDAPHAVETITNLALLLDAEPRFMAPAEHDAVRALANALPDLLGAALLRSVVAAPGWQETAKAIGHSFAHVTAAVAEEAASRQMMAHLSRGPLLRGIDALQAELSELRRHIEAGDSEALAAAYAEAAEARARWITRERAERDASSEPPGLFQRLGRTFLGERLMQKSQGQPPKPDRET
jgi:prephenate dehydrogenase